MNEMPKVQFAAAMGPYTLPLDVKSVDHVLARTSHRKNARVVDEQVQWSFPPLPSGSKFPDGCERSHIKLLHLCSHGI
jgi:hypothetical protein